MPNSDAVYFVTQTGRKAWWSPTSGLPIHYRQILSLVRLSLPVAEIAGKLEEYSLNQLTDWLAELETLGFIGNADGQSAKPEYRDHDADGGASSLFIKRRATT